MTDASARRPPERLSVLIPARDEEGCVGATVEHLHEALRRAGVPHEILVVDDGSTDRTGAVLEGLAGRIPELRSVRNPGPHGYGRAVRLGLEQVRGDAVVVMMADESDDCADVLRYWEKLREGFDCVFGSRFVAGGRTVGYPLPKLVLNRLANAFLSRLFCIRLNDTTNAFKAYRREVVAGCQPLEAEAFDLTIELPLKAIVRGYTWTVIPVGWRNRRTGVAKLKIHEMGSRYLATSLAVWREKRRRDAGRT